MKKFTRIVLILLVLIFIAWLFAPLPEHKQYKESDWYSYFSYTDTDIKNSPKISNDYIYHFDVTDGGYREMSSILFYGATDASQLVNYLKNLGFSLARRVGDGTEEVWLSPKNRGVVFSVSYDKKERIVRLTKTIL